MPEIDDAVDTFFAAFTSGPGVAERVAALRALLLPTAVVVRGGPPTVYDVDAFLDPRQALLESGALVDFSEHPLDVDVRVFGDVADVRCSYTKSGVQDGVAFTGRGTKSLQLLRLDGTWRISAVAWDDER